MLMLTQGWRRYSVAELAQGRFTEPSSPVEIGPEISGTVRSLSRSRPVADVDVTALSLNDELFDHALTDRDGRFILRGNEFADNTLLIVSATSQNSVNLVIDEETFPKRTLPDIPPAEIDRQQFARYIDKANQKYVSEGGMREYDLPEVTVSAQRKLPSRSVLYETPPTSVITEKDIETFSGADIGDFFQMKIPSAQIRRDKFGQFASI